MEIYCWFGMTRHDTSVITFGNDCDTVVSFKKFTPQNTRKIKLKVTGVGRWIHNQWRCLADHTTLSPNLLLQLSRNGSFLNDKRTSLVRGPLQAVVNREFGEVECASRLHVLTHPKQ
jgi:hypothetical protein